MHSGAFCPDSDRSRFFKPPASGGQAEHQPGMKVEVEYNTGAVSVASSGASGDRLDEGDTVEPRGADEVLTSDSPGFTMRHRTNPTHPQVGAVPCPQMIQK